MRRRPSRPVALAVSATLVAIGAAALGAVAPAQAAGQTMTYSAGPFVGGETVTITVSGFSPEAPVAISECPYGRRLTGPGDCGRSSLGFAKLVTADALGHATATLVVANGALHNQTPPAASCDFAHRCVFAAVNIAHATEIVKRSIPYALPASPTLLISPSGPLKAGQRVDVAATGFSPDAPVAFQQCALTRVPLGPGDCGRSAAGALVLVVADGQGVARARMTLVVGPLANQTPPASTCGPDRPCKYTALNIADPSEMVEAQITFSPQLVTPRIGFRTDEASVWRGAPVHVAGSVAPNQEFQRVLLQRHASTGWVTVSSSELTTSSSYSSSWKPRAAGVYWLRVVLPGTRYHPAAYSVSRRLEVVG